MCVCVCVFVKQLKATAECEKVGKFTQVLNYKLHWIFFIILFLFVLSFENALRFWQKFFTYF